MNKDKILMNQNKSNESAEGAVGGRSYNFIDLLKFICAALVIAIHVPPFGGKLWLLNFATVNFVARIAVPFFLVSSSYFVFKKAYAKGKLDRLIILNYVKKIFRLYVIWSLIYLPFTYYHMTETFGSLTLWQFLKKFLLQFIFSASYGHLWYLNAVVFSYLFLLIMLSANIKPAVIAIFSLFMYCIGLLAQSWFGIIEPLRQYSTLWTILSSCGKIIVTTRNGLCEGLLFVLMGMFFATDKIVMRIKTATVCFAGSVCLFAAEVFVLTRLEWIREYDMYLGLIPTVFFLFYLSLNIRLENRAIYKKLRTLSALTYFSHMIFAEVLILVPALGGMPGGGLSQYLFTFAASLLFSSAVMKLSARFKILGFLYK